jgi:hypothetical protein
MIDFYCYTSSQARNWPKILDEMTEAHLDTIEMVREARNDDDAWETHVAYLQALVRYAREQRSWSAATT